MGGLLEHLFGKGSGGGRENTLEHPFYHTAPQPRIYCTAPCYRTLNPIQTYYTLNYTAP